MPWFCSPLFHTILTKSQFFRWKMRNMYQLMLGIAVKWPDFYILLPWAGGRGEWQGLLMQCLFLWKKIIYKGSKPTTGLAKADYCACTTLQNHGRSKAPKCESFKIEPLGKIFKSNPATSEHKSSMQKAQASSCLGHFWTCYPDLFMSHLSSIHWGPLE